MASLLITGANRGIGLEFVRQLAESKEGKWKHIFAACRNPAKAESLQKLAAIHPHVTPITLDVTDDATIEAAVKEVSSVVKENGLNVLINNAGIIALEPLEKVNREMLHEYFNVNTAGPLIIVQKFLPLLKQGAATSKVSGLSFYRGSIFNMTSGMGSISDNTSGKMYAYRASKAALNMVSRSLSVDLKADNILAISLAPGWVQTDMGGKNATLKVEDCVSMLLKEMETAGENENGKVVNFRGGIYPW
ncbi:hypothetical protein HOLleu_10897 [Holothuria leucospilota]|uniref:Uncharacterized protein n=1 Tax=Holothuria leucospilota TaxID=206669 RepID=A0A9Q1HC01_HOLLE|nr:hypothetical protein HOLleu_10897 [Holothuria leucospilota]